MAISQKFIDPLTQLDKEATTLRKRLRAVCEKMNVVGGKPKCLVCNHFLSVSAAETSPEPFNFSAKPSTTYTVFCTSCRFQMPHDNYIYRMKERAEKPND